MAYKLKFVNKTFNQYIEGMKDAQTVDRQHAYTRKFDYDETLKDINADLKWLKKSIEEAIKLKSNGNEWVTNLGVMKDPAEITSVLDHAIFIYCEDVAFLEDLKIGLEETSEEWSKRHEKE